MRRIVSDLWKVWIGPGEPYYVVPVNCGFNDRGQAIMGAGVAKQAADRYPAARAIWGKQCVEAAARGVLPDVYVDWTSRFVFFPTKGRWDQNPSLSWQAPSNLQLIELSAQQLAVYVAQRFPHEAVVYLPLVGCGLGRLRREDVLPILGRHLNDRFVLVEQGPTWCSSYETTRVR